MLNYSCILDTFYLVITYFKIYYQIWFVNSLRILAFL